MIAVIDSGSTKADWIISDGSETIQLNTPGMNPCFVNEKEIVDLSLEKIHEKKISKKIEKVFFFGAGCSDNELKKIVKNAFQILFPNAKILIDSDMMGAVLATCGNDPGIVGILGTGSNSVFYDGQEIKPNNYGLGFILADEGAGTDIGKRLITSYFYGLMPEHLSIAFRQKYNLSKETLFKKVYGNPTANAWLASFVGFTIDNKDPWINQLVKSRFEEFARLFIMNYPGYKKIPVHFVGSIAFHFAGILKTIADENDFKIGKIIHKPIQSLFEYFNGKT